MRLLSLLAYRVQLVSTPALSQAHTVVQVLPQAAARAGLLAVRLKFLHFNRL